MSSTKQANAQSKESRIIQAATLLFSEKGYHHSSTRQIAKSAGVSEGTVFNYFDNKSVLLEEVIKGFYTRLSDTAQEGLLTMHSSHEKFTFLAQNHMRIITDDNFLLMRLLAVYFSEHFNLYLDYRSSSIYKHSKMYTRIFDNLINDAITRQELKNDTKLSAMRDLFFGSLEYGVRSLLAQSGPSEVKISDQKLAQYASTLSEPIWQSMQASFNNKTESPNSQELKLCERLERIVDRLEAKT